MVILNREISELLMNVDKFANDSVKPYQDLLAVKEKECKNLNELVFELVGEIERLQKELKVKKGAK